jgi:hypothetical protein
MRNRAARATVLAALAACASVALAGPVSAQLGGLIGKKSPASAVDVDKALSAGSDLLGYITLANDLGMQGADYLIAMYPDEKVGDIKKASAQAKELKAKRKDGKIDAEEIKSNEDVSAKLAALEKEDMWKGYKKENAANVKKANGKLGLMLLADGVAGTLVKPTTDNLQAALKEISKDPTKVAKADVIKGQISSLAAIAPSLPKQVESAKTVRSVCSKIAEAEKVKLGSDPPVEKVKDLASLQTAAKDIE